MASSIVSEWVKSLWPKIDDDEKDKRTEEGDSAKRENKGHGSERPAIEIMLLDPASGLHISRRFLERMSEHQRAINGPDSRFLLECRLYIDTSQFVNPQWTITSEKLLKLWEAHTKSQIGQKKRSQVLLRALYLIKTLQGVLGKTSEQEIALFQVEMMIDSFTEFLLSKSSSMDKAEADTKEEAQNTTEIEQDQISPPDARKLASICMTFVFRMERHSKLVKQEDRSFKHFDETHRLLWAPQLKLTPKMTALTRLVTKLWKAQENTLIEERRRRQILTKVMYCVATILQISPWISLSSEEQDLAISQAEALVKYTTVFFRDSVQKDDKAEADKKND